jgi:hypothetical protein
MSEGTAEDFDDRTIGRRLKRIRQSRKKSLRVIAGLAGISASHLSRIENGERALDRRSLVVALANALQVSPAELTSLPVPAPVDGTSDSSIQAVRRALMAVSAGLPGGEVQPVEQLVHRANQVEKVSYDQRGVLLPSLIADLHTTMAVGKDMPELLRTAAMLHSQTVRGFFYIVGAPLDLRWQATLFGRQAVEELGDATMRGVVAWATVIETLATGVFDLAWHELDSTDVPNSTSEGMQLNGMLALSRSLVAAADQRPAERTAALETATEIAERTGQGDAFRLGFGPTNVAIWKMAASLEAGEPDETVRIARETNPEQHHSRERRATYWADFGRALARVRRRDDAVKALRRGEQLFPMRILRNPYTRDSIAELVAHSKNDDSGREIRGMAYRAGLPV